jgi:hypothetical protein
MTLVMKKAFVIVLLVTFSCVLSAQAQEIEIRSEVANVDPGLEFLVIKAGENDGVELGDGLLVHRSGQKIAEAYIVELRGDVSAAEILNMEEGQKILEGDGILIVKERSESPAASSIPMPAMAPRESVRTAAVSPEIVKKGDVVSIDIKKPAKEVFAYARLMLMENGYSIVSSNRSSGILLATKPIPLSIINELWADALAAIDHKLVVSLDIKDKDRLTEIRASSFKEHSQKGRHIKRPVVRNSKDYNELMVLVSQIKERSER